MFLTAADAAYKRGSFWTPARHDCQTKTEVAVMMCKYVGLRRYSALHLLNTCKVRAWGVGKLGRRNEEPDNRKEEEGKVERTGEQTIN